MLLLGVVCRLDGVSRDTGSWMITIVIATGFDRSQ